MLLRALLIMDMEAPLNLENFKLSYGGSLGLEPVRNDKELLYIAEQGFTSLVARAN